MDIPPITQIFPINKLFKIGKDKNKQKQDKMKPESQINNKQVNEGNEVQHIDEIV